MPNHDLDRMKEVHRGARMIADFLWRSQQRSDTFIAQLIPLLGEEAKRKIIDSNEWRSRDGKRSDEELLRQHLSELIMDFDCNVHYLEEKEIPALAEVINKKPLISFIGPD